MGNGHVIMYKNKAYGRSVGDTDSIKFRSQLLTSEKKKIARNNIGAVGSINGTTPDEEGNINITRVPLADNIFSPDNQEILDKYILRTSGGAVSIDSGVAQVVFIRGNSVVEGRVEESITEEHSAFLRVTIDRNNFVAAVSDSGDLEFTYTLADGWKLGSDSIDFADYGIAVYGILEESATATSSNEELTIAVNAQTFGEQVSEETGTYLFAYDGSDWLLNEEAVNLTEYGVSVTGDASVGDTISVYYVAATESAYVTVHYTKYEAGEIKNATPTQFKATGLNQFDKENNVLEDYSIDGDGNVSVSSGMYVCWCKAVGGLADGYTIYAKSGVLTRVGWYDEVPDSTTEGIELDGATLGSSLSYYDNSDLPDGYICVATTDPEGLCIHPTWSGYEDETYEEYSTSFVQIPLEDKNAINLPTATYGMPSVAGVGDELSFDLKQYVKNIERVINNAQNMAQVKSLGVEYDYDNDYIYYILDTPVVYQLASGVTGEYEVADFGIEEMVGTDVSVIAENLYGRNLRDYLRVTVPNAITSLTNEESYTVETTDWVANTDTGIDTSYYTMKAEVNTVGVTGNTPFQWHMDGTGIIPSESELESINMVLEAVAVSNKVILYATDTPTDDLKFTMVGGK